MSRFVFAGVLWRGLGRKEEPEEGHGQQYSHDHAQAHERVHPGPPRSAETEHRFQGAERLGRVQIGRPDVLVAGIAGGRQLQGRAVNHGPLEAPLEQRPTQKDQPEQPLGHRSSRQLLLVADLNLLIISIFFLFFSELSVFVDKTRGNDRE